MNNEDTDITSHAMHSYWLLRISYEYDVSHALLNAGYVSIGWGIFAGSDILDSVRRDDGRFQSITESLGYGAARSRYNMFYLAQIKPGDIVVVPEAGTLRIVEAREVAISVVDLPEGFSCTTADGDVITYNDQTKALQSQKNPDRDIDIGFVLKVEELCSVNRSVVAADLARRAKTRQTIVNITDLTESVEEALTLDHAETLTIHDTLAKSLADTMLGVLHKRLSPDALEALVKWYLQQQGGTAWIPSKRESGKSDYADADVIAEFEDLGVTIIVQVKNHSGATNEWAVQQIARYLEQNVHDAHGLVTIPWVITTADEFTPEAIALAEQNNVRLITGKEFAEMLVDCDLSGIDLAFL